MVEERLSILYYSLALLHRINVGLVQHCLHLMRKRKRLVSSRTRNMHKKEGIKGKLTRVEKFQLGDEFCVNFFPVLVFEPMTSRCV